MSDRTPQPLATPVPAGPAALAGPNAPRRGSRRRRPRRTVHLMAFTAAVAMAIGLPPTLVGMLKNPATAWGEQDRSAYVVASGLAFATPVFTLIALWDGRVGVRRAARSYGGSAVLAATAAMALLSARAFASTLAMRLRVPGRDGVLATACDAVFPYPGSYFSPIAWRVVAEGAEGIVAAIVAAWAVLAVSGKGRRPALWFDLFCFLLGLGWVVWLLGRDLAPPGFSR